MYTALLVASVLGLAPLLILTLFAVLNVQDERRFRDRAYIVLNKVGPLLDDESRDLVHSDIRESLAAERQIRKSGVALGCLLVLCVVVGVRCVFYVF